MMTSQELNLTPAEFAMITPFDPVRPNVFSPGTDSSPTKSIHDWLNRESQKGRVELTTHKEGRYWCATLRSTCPGYGNLEFSAFENTKILATTAATIFFREHVLFQMSQSVQSQANPTNYHHAVTSLVDSVKVLALNEPFVNEYTVSPLSPIVSALPVIDDVRPNSSDENASGIESQDIEQAQNTAIGTATGLDSDIVVSLQPERSISYMDGGIHEFQTLVDRYIHVEQIDWSTAHPPGKILATIHMPVTAVLNNLTSPNVLPFAQHLFARPHMTHKLVINSTEFHSGTLFIAVRYNNASTAGQAIVDTAQLMPMPHAVIQACSANTAELEVPYMHPLPWCPNTDTQTGEAMYYHTIYIGVQNALGIGTGGSTTVTLQLFSKFCTSKETTSFSMLRGRADLSTVVSANYACTKPYKLNYVRPNGPVLSTVSNVANTVSSVSKFVESTAKGAGALMRSNNQDRPIVTHDIPYVVVQPSVNMPIGQGAKDSISMRLDKSCLAPFPKDLIPIADTEYSFDFLKKVKGLSHTFKWDINHIRGTTLLTFPVTPVVGYPIASDFLLPTISELSSNFDYFSGNLILNFLFGSSFKHSGRVVVVFHPDFIPNANTIDYVDDYAYVVLDLKTQLEFNFEIPNACPTHLCPIFKTGEDGSVQGIFTYGYVSVLVETPLKVINSIASEIDCSVFLNAHDNFNLYVPRNNAIKPLPTENLGVLLPNADRTGQCMAVTGYNIADIPEATIGEHFDLFSTSRRYSLLFSKQFTADNAGDYIVEFDVNFGLPETRTATSNLDIITQMHDGFRFSKGSLNYIVHVRGAVDDFVVRHVPRCDTSTKTLSIRKPTALEISSFSGYSNQVVTAAVNNVVDINVPYYNNHAFMTNYFNPTLAGEEWAVSRYCNGKLQVFLQDCSTNPFTVDVYRALGDDSEQFCYQGFPLRSATSFNNFINKFIPINDSRKTFTVRSWTFLAAAKDAHNAGNVAVLQRLENTHCLLLLLKPESAPYFSNAKLQPTPTVAQSYSYGTTVNAKTFTSTVFSLHNGSCINLFFGGKTANPATGYSLDFVANKLDLSYVKCPTVSPYVAKNYAYQIKIFKADGTLLVNTTLHDADVGVTYDYKDIMGGYCDIVMTHDPSDTRSEQIEQTSKLTDIRPNAPGSQCSLNPDFPRQATPPAQVTPEAVWAACRKGNRLRRKYSFKDKTLQHYRTLMIGVSKRARSKIFFEDIDDLSQEFIPNVGLFEAATAGLHTLTGNISGLASSIVGGITAMRVGAAADAAKTAADAVTTRLNEIPTMVRDGASTLTSTIANFGSVIIDAIKSRLEGVLPDFVATITSAFLHVYALFASTDWTVKVTSFIGLLCSLGLFCLNQASKIFSMVSGIVTQTSSLVPNSPEEDAATDRQLNVWLRFLVPALVVFAGAPSDFAKKGIFACKDIFFSLVRGANDMTRFVNSNLDFIREFYYWLIGETNPHIPATLMLQDKVKEMEAWAAAVLEITQGHMRDVVAASAGKQKHLDLLYREGCTYLSLYKHRNLDSQAFMQLFRRLSELHSSIGQRVGMGRLVREPISFWFTGPTGVGKSNVAGRVMQEVLIEMGIVYDGPCIYVRNATDFWNGWADQPAVLWDDWGQNQSEAAFSQSISEYFSITSIAEFNANMPAIEDKNRMVNPYVVCVCANRSQFSTNLVLERSALNRRRDFLVHCEFAPKYLEMKPPIDSASDPRISKEDLESANHLRFTLLDRQTNKTLDGSTPKMTYARFLEVIKPRVESLSARLTTAAEKRLEQQYALTPEAWKKRLEDGVVPQTLIDSVTASIGASEGSVTLTDAISSKTPSSGPTPANPNCAFCIDEDLPVYEVPHPVPWRGFMDLDAPDVKSAYPCICESLPQCAEFCHRKAAFFVAAEDNPWFQDADDATLAEDIFIDVFSTCGDNCKYKRNVKSSLETVDQATCSNLDPLISARSTRERLTAFGEGWRLRNSELPSLGVSEMIEFLYQNAPKNDNDVLLPTPATLLAFKKDHTAPLKSSRPLTITDIKMRRAAKIAEDFHEDVESISRVSVLSMLVSKLKTVVWVLAFYVGYRLLWIIVCHFFPTIMKVVQVGVFVVSRAIFQLACHEFAKMCLDHVFPGAGCLIDYCTCKNIFCGNVASSGDVKTARVPSVAPKIYVGNAPIASAAIDMAPEDSAPRTADIEKKIKRNTVILEQYLLGTDNRVCYQVFSPGSNVILMPYHYSDSFKAYAKSGYKARLHVWSDIAGVKSVYELDLSKVEPVRFDRKDLCAWRLPDTVPLFKSMVGCFATIDDCSNKFRGQAMLVAGRDPNNAYEKTTRVFDKVKFVQGEMTYELRLEGNVQLEMLGYRYPYARPGVCMAALVSTRTNQIIGFHTTGSKDDLIGYSTVCPRELVQKLVRVPSPVVPQGPLSNTCPEVGDMSRQMQNLGYSVTEVRTVSPKEALRTSVKQTIFPTPMHGVLSPPSRFPVKVTSQNDVQPGYAALAKAVQKGFADTEPFPADLVDQAADHFKKELLVKAVPATHNPVLVRSDRQAILGIEGVQFCEGLKLNTSPGWPLCVLRPGADKTSFIKTDADRSFLELDPLLERMLEKELEQRKSGVVPESVYADFGKDERLKPGKDMRLINGCPLVQTIIWRKYTMDFMAAFQRAQLDVGSAIGLNVFGLGMDKMAQKLLEKGNNILTGDYKNFGPSLHPEVVIKLIEVMDAWYRKNVIASEEEHAEASRVRRTLVMSVINSLHIAGDLIYSTAQGCPSGNPWTAPINTFVQILYLRILWLIIFAGTQYASLDCMLKYFAYICYGDDFVGSIDSKLLPLFNNVTMTKVFSKFKIIFTDPCKTGTVDKLACPLSEASFLKCTFARHVSRDLYVAHLDMSVILDIVNWWRMPVVDEEAHLRELSDQTCRYLSLYGPDVYNKHTSKLADWFASRDMFYYPAPWPVMDSVFDCGEDIPWIDLWA